MLLSKTAHPYRLVEGIPESSVIITFAVTLLSIYEEEINPVGGELSILIIEELILFTDLLLL
jgi:hypothetical protein